MQFRKKEISIMLKLIKIEYTKINFNNYYYNQMALACNSLFDY